MTEWTRVKEDASPQEMSGGCGALTADRTDFKDD